MPGPPTKEHPASRLAGVYPESRRRTFIRVSDPLDEFRPGAWLLLGVALLVGPPARADVGDPNFYAASLDTDVTYDSALAESYDDGYGPRAYAQFETALAPYGAWVDEPALGRVWVPSVGEVGADFAPYWTNGHWVFTEYGWTWESGWEWGWAPFHYGRWAMVEGRGWCWVPGTLWGPSWVAWRAGRINVGWAPLPPRGMHLGRPIGTRSPWRFARAATLGTTVMEPVPLRNIPGLFGRTASVTTARAVSIGRLKVRFNAGPIGPKCCGDRTPPRLSFAELAPHAVPRFGIKPRQGAPLPSRPWVAAGAREQTPIHRWPSSHDS